MTKAEFVCEFERRHGRSRSTRVEADLYTHLLPSYTEEDIERAWEEYTTKAEECEKSYLAYLKKRQERFLRNRRKYKTVKG